MIKLSNLRLELGYKFHFTEAVQARIVCDMEADFTNVKEFFFCVDEENADCLTDDVYDAFLIAALYPAMCYGEDIHIDGKVTKRTYHNLKQYVQGMVLAYEPNFHEIDIKVEGFSHAHKNENLHVGTGFSGGVDSFSTLVDNYFHTDDSDYKIDSLYFFHVGQYGYGYDNPINYERANNRYGLTREFAYKIGLSSLMLNTNMFSFYQPHWEFDAGIFCRLACVFVLQRSLKRYYISNSATYREAAKLDFITNHVDLAEIVDPMIMPLLSPEGMEIVCDGAQHERTEKTLNISDNPIAQKYLNVCVSTGTRVAAKNCGHCTKCLRTMMALDSIGALDKFSAVFDLDDWKKNGFLYKCKQVCLYNKSGFAQDNVNFARKMGKKLPNKFIAFCVVKYDWLCHLPQRIIRKFFS